MKPSRPARRNVTSCAGMRVLARVVRNAAGASGGVCGAVQLRLTTGGVRRRAVIGLLCLLVLLGAVAPVRAATARQQYNAAEKCYKRLRNHPARQKYRQHWLVCIDKFEGVYRANPTGSWAPAGLYMAADLYLKLYRRSYLEADRQEALDLYARIILHFPHSVYRQRAQRALHAQQTKTRRTGGAYVAQTDPAAKHRETKRAGGAQAPTAGPALVTGLRFWSNPNYTRVVIDADSEAAYHHRLLKKDPSLHKPRRLYIDLEHCRLSKTIQRKIPIHDDLLSSVRAGQYTLNSVRVVMDIKSFKRYKIFSLRNPFRIVVDVWGSGSVAAAPVARSKARSHRGKGVGDLARQLSLGVRRIVIDAGHGGHDYGAPGYFKGVYEKNITLQIARRLAAKIRKELHYQVIMTRTRDHYLTLEERTAIANTRNADLFISIHANAARNHLAAGIETYFLNLATDEDAILVAARENATSRKNISDLQTILNDLMQHAKINESARLAEDVESALVRYMKARYPQIRSKGVKQAPFYVLLGAQMPAILVETSFISNPRECHRLTSPKYQNDLCNGIILGIRKYVRQMHPKTLTRADFAK